jgi:hypothetical protein
MTWVRDSNHPAPFFVQVLQHYSPEIKLAWMRQEGLGGSVPIDQFATKFIHLFGSTITTKDSQRTAIFDTYSLYTGVTLSKECKMDLDERVDFQRVWDPELPKLCYECKKPRPVEAKRFCSLKCEDASKILMCKMCKKTNKGCQYCSPVPPCVPKAMADQLRMAQRMWFVSSVEDPSHEPAWKKQRRS